MAKWNVPDDLDARVQSHVKQHGGDVADFITRAVAGQLAYEDDTALQAEITSSIKRGIADVEAGRTRPAKQALREIADELNIDLDR